jgi:hypothetical protein
MSRVGKKAEELNRPLYVAPRKEKKKMPENVKHYLSCITKGETKSVCKKKHLGENHD